jgi:small subunit ribosomal protein S3
MGQKVNPQGIRIGITKSWDSTWFPPKGDYAKYLNQDVSVRKYLQKEFKGLGVARIELQSTPGTMNLVIHAAKPGLIIGQQGAKIDELREKLEKVFNIKFGINVVEIPKPAINAFVISESVAQQVERRISYRRAAKVAIDKAMESGAKGIKIKLGGRLNGVEIARSEFFSKGQVPLQTLRADIDYSYIIASTTYGTIGIKVWVYNGDVLKKKNKTDKN